MTKSYEERIVLNRQLLHEMYKYDVDYCKLKVELNTECSWRHSEHFYHFLSLSLFLSLSFFLSLSLCRYMLNVSDKLTGEMYILYSM